MHGLFNQEKLLTRNFTIQGYKFGISISITLHLFVVLLLINAAEKPLNNLVERPKIKPIQSFIYYKPAENIKAKIVDIPVKNYSDKELEKMPSAEEEQQSSIEEIQQKNSLSNPIVPSEQPILSAEVTSIPLNNVQKKPLKNYTSSQSLSRLKDRINQKIIKQEIYNYSRPKTGSVMDGTPNYVPHSFVEDTEKKAIAASPSQVGNGFSITKNDNGNCTLTEDLSTIGLQGKTTSQFNCGLSKDEKAFKDHMKKVLKKLGK